MCLALQMIFQLQDILVIGQTMTVCYAENYKKHRKENVKLNKNKYHIRCTSIQLFGKIISRQGMRSHLRKLKVITDMLPPKLKKELQTFSDILKYLS